MTGNEIVNRVDGYTISKAFPSTDSENSNSDEIEIVGLVKKAGKHPIYTRSNGNKSEDTYMNKAIKCVSKA